MRVAWRVLLSKFPISPCSSCCIKIRRQSIFLASVSQVSLPGSITCQLHYRNLHFTLSKMDPQNMKPRIEVADSLQNGLQNGEINAGRPAADQNMESPAILRYEEGAEFYQLTCCIQRKTFNFSRRATEPISTLYDRFIKNASKKVKNFEENVKLMLGDRAVDPNESLVSILGKLDWKSTKNTQLTLQVDNESLQI